MSDDMPTGKQVKLKPSLWQRVEAEADRRVVGRNLFIQRALEEVLEMIEGQPIPRMTPQPDPKPPDFELHQDDCLYIADQWVCTYACGARAAELTDNETSELAKENLNRWSPTTSSNTPTPTPPNTAPAEEKPQPEP